MPPKRKDNAGTPAASGPKQKRSKTSFRTPTTAGLEGSAETEMGLTTNRVVTLRASASGRRGYRTQDLSTTPSSSHDSLAAENLALPSDISDTSYFIPPATVDLETDTVDTQPGSSAKSKRKQKNTTTVR
jgi:hypothetical protein